LWAVERVAVDGAGAGVHPDLGWGGGGGDELAEEEGGFGSGVEDLLAVFGVVAAVYGAAGEVDDGVAAVDFDGPWAGREAVPCEGAPVLLRVGVRVAGEDGDLVALLIEMTCEEGADLAGAAGDKDSHGERLRQECLLRLRRFRSMSISGLSVPIGATIGRLQAI